MDKHRFFQLLRSFLLAWALSWGSSMCLAAGLSREFPQGMGAVWGGVSLAFTAALAKGGPALLLIPGTLAALAMGNLLIPLGLGGCLTALGVCLTVCKGKGLSLSALAALAPLGVCLAPPGAAPRREALFLLLVGLGVLLVTAHTRFQHPRQGNRLAAAAAPVLAAAVGAFLLLSPPESYVNHSAVLRDLLSGVLPAVAASGESALAAVTVAPTQVVLRQSPRTPSSQTVMTVTAQEDGKLYLRERSYNYYDGSTWSAEGEAEEFFSGPPGNSREVTVSTRGQREHLLVGYYPAEGVTLTGGAVPNTHGATQYTLRCTALVYSPITQALPVSEDLAPYLTLPETTRQGTRALVPTAGSASSKARAIGDYLRRGTYTLYPENLPAEGEDFVLSFLEGDMAGCCTHFAAAAAVLLRSAGVPARMVAGYLVDGVGGQAVTVTEKDAHAWAEFYEPGLDAWLILDATPPAPPPMQETADTPAAQTEKPDLLLPGLILGLLLAEVQYWVRRLLRWLRCVRAAPNRRALVLWREAQTLSRLLREPVSAELATLARKACFSPHQLTEGELSVFTDALGQLRRRVKKKYLFSRLVLRWVFGVY